MKAKPRLYVEGESRDLDALAKLYEKVEGNDALAERPEEPEERSPDDPLGLKRPRTEAPVAPDQRAQEFAVRLVKFAGWCWTEFGLTPEELVYGTELAALNILNARDCPLTPAQVDAVRARAGNYFARSLAAIPEPKART